jgi:hypothetical protein
LQTARSIRKLVTSRLLSNRWDTLSGLGWHSKPTLPNHRRDRAGGPAEHRLGATDLPRKYLDYSVCGRIPAGGTVMGSRFVAADIRRMQPDGQSAAPKFVFVF